MKVFKQVLKTEKSRSARLSSIREWVDTPTALRRVSLLLYRYAYIHNVFNIHQRNSIVVFCLLSPSQLVVVVSTRSVLER